MSILDNQTASGVTKKLYAGYRNAGTFGYATGIVLSTTIAVAIESGTRGVCFNLNPIWFPNPDTVYQVSVSGSIVPTYGAGTIGANAFITVVFGSSTVALGVLKDIAKSSMTVADNSANERFSFNLTGQFINATAYDYGLWIGNDTGAQLTTATTYTINNITITEMTPSYRQILASNIVKP